MEITVEFDELRSIYREFYGYLLVAPKREDYASQNGKLIESQLWTRFNNTLARLNALTQNRYSGYSIQPKPLSSDRTFYIDVDDYKSNLYGLIFKIHSDFYNDEPFPIDKTDTGQIVLNQSISQQQSVSINIFKEQIEEKSKEYKEGTKERSFLNKFKEYVSTTNNVADIIKKCFDLASKFDLKMDDVIRMFN